MRISTKGRYAVSIMLDLALDGTGDYITLKTIAERQGLSGKYLEQIISILNKAGYVKSTRGSQGGYKLSKHSKEYTLGMILRLMEGNMSPVPGLDDNDGICTRQNYFGVYKAWEKLERAINGVIDGITLQDLVDWQIEEEALADNA